MDVNQVTTALETAYTGGFDALVSAYPSDQGVTGQFFDRGIVYDYSITDRAIEYQENRSDSEYIADYYRGTMDAAGIRCDSDNPYEYYRGRFQVNLDAARPLKCKNGTPCGGRCLPRGQKCRVAGGVASPKGSAMQGSGGSREEQRKGLSKAAKIALGIGGAYVGLNVAAGVGALAYAHHLSKKANKEGV